MGGSWQCLWELMEVRKHQVTCLKPKGLRVPAQQLEEWKRRGQDVRTSGEKSSSGCFVRTALVVTYGWFDKSRSVYTMVVVASVPFPTVADAQNRFISITDFYLFIKAQNSHNFDALVLQFSKTEGKKIL